MTDKPPVLVIGPLPQRDLDAMARRFTVLPYFAATDKAAYLAEHGASVRAVSTRGETGINAEQLAALPNLGIVACYAVGTDMVDLAACRARNIPVTNTAGVLTDEVADMALALLLAAFRQIPAADAWVRSGTWAAQGAMPLQRRMYGKRLGIVGLGEIGRAVARRAEGFAMPIAYSGRSKQAVPYAYYPNPLAMAPHVDALVVCAAGGPATRNLVSAAVIAALPKGAVLVNVARGTVVEEAAVIEALRSGHLGAAGLDVFLNEPAIDPVFATFPNVVLQPHAASATYETRGAMGDLMLANMEAWLDGRPLLTPVA